MAHHGTSFHSVCRWTFNAGKGGFVPASMRPEWDGSRLDTAGAIRLIKKEIAPRMPGHVQLGFEVHYNTEVDERTAPAVADALGERPRRHDQVIELDAHRGPRPRQAPMTTVQGFTRQPVTTPFTT